MLPFRKRKTRVGERVLIILVRRTAILSEALTKRNAALGSRMAVVRRFRALFIYDKNPEISVVAKVEFPIGKKLFHLVVNPGTWPGARPWTWNWYKLQETSMEHDIPFGNSNRENGTTFLDFPLFLGIFQWDEPTKRVPFTAEPEIPEILTKWKAPLIRAFLACW